MFCEKCGTRLDPEDLFCPTCGWKNEPGEETLAGAQQVGKLCPRCGAQNVAEDLFCAACGASLQEETVEKAQGHKKKQKTDGVSRRKTATGKKKKTALLVAIPLCAVLVLGLFGAWRLWEGKSEHSEVLYLKDNTLYRNMLNKKDPIEVEDNIFSGNGYFPGAPMEALYQYSPDGKYLFFAKQDENGMKLYDIQCRKKKAEKEKIASKVVEYAISQDSKTVLWRDTDNKLYVQDFASKTNKEKLDSDVTSVEGYTSDFQWIFYKKEGTGLCALKNRKESVEIAPDVCEVAFAEVEGVPQILYVQERAEERKLADFVQDDMAEGDAAIGELDGAGFWTGDVGDYDFPVEAYQEKLERDELRQMLQEESVTVKYGSLSAYDCATGKSTKLGEGYMGSSVLRGYGMVEQTLVAIASWMPKEEMGTYSFSDLYESRELDTLRGWLRARLEKGGNAYLIHGKNSSCILPGDEGTIKQAQVASDCGKVYVGICEDGQEELTIAEVSCEPDSFGATTTLYDDVEYWQTQIPNRIYYFQDVENGEGELYCEGRQIAEEVAIQELVTAGKDGEAVLYYTDVRGEKGGTLMLYNGNKSKEVAEKVVDYIALSEQKIIMLDHYRQKHGAGDLEYYNGKTVRELDSNVTALIHVPGELSQSRGTGAIGFTGIEGETVVSETEAVAEAAVAETEVAEYTTTEAADVAAETEVEEW